ncbi:hypothetical protein QBC44DRAFT_391981 [Cladorrhinum sp. PSN332]|nr:hypothetical protein QBC44DRAFT_391981 [Cladorrhinum sp. PSN332]
MAPTCKQCRNTFCAEKTCGAKDTDLPLRCGYQGHQYDMFCIPCRQEHRKDCTDCGNPRACAMCFRKLFKSYEESKLEQNLNHGGKASTTWKTTTDQEEATNPSDNGTTATAAATESTTTAAQGFTLSPEQCHCELTALTTLPCWASHKVLAFCDKCDRSVCSQCIKTRFCHSKYNCGSAVSCCRDIKCYSELNECPDCGGDLYCGGGGCDMDHPNSDGEYPRDSADEDSADDDDDDGDKD